MEEIQEKSLQREAVTTDTVAATTAFADLDAEVKLAIQCASDKKAFDMVALDLREIASFTEFFIIVSGANQRQVQAIADEINNRPRKTLNAYSPLEVYRDLLLNHHSAPDIIH